MDARVVFPEALAARRPQMFPTLTPAQIQRIASHGRIRPVSRGEVLVEVGDRSPPFFVVTRGRAEVALTSGGLETVITEHGPGQFTGEVLLLAGRPAVGRT